MPLMLRTHIRVHSPPRLKPMRLGRDLSVWSTLQVEWTIEMQRMAAVTERSRYNASSQGHSRRHSYIHNNTSTFIHKRILA